MPEPVYADFLTRESARRLHAVLADVPHPVALVGGHAVRLRVLDAWTRQHGTEYFGSRDIDVVYQVDPSWSIDEFRASAAGQAPRRIRDAGFRPLANNRFGIIIDSDGRALDREPGPPKFATIDYDTLYLDPLVTNMHPGAKEILGYEPTDEPLAALVFRDAAHRTIVSGFENVYLPSASVLVATKLSGLSRRTKDDKAVKDMCDLYALIQFGGVREREIRRVLHAVLPDRAARLVDDAVRSEHLAAASRHLDLEERGLRAVLAPLALP
ncbi:MAG: nucleotidyl transferase AbiEii/AbiGii toxin family protein [Methanobacteriota archaeon]